MSLLDSQLSLIAFSHNFIDLLINFETVFSSSLLVKIISKYTSSQLSSTINLLSITILVFSLSVKSFFAHSAYDFNMLYIVLFFSLFSFLKEKLSFNFGIMISSTIRLSKSLPHR